METEKKDMEPLSPVWSYRRNLITAKKEDIHPCNITIAMGNIQSLKYKELQVSELIKDYSIDLLVLSEMWLTSKDHWWTQTISLNRHGLNLYIHNRKGRKMGRHCTYQ